MAAALPAVFKLAAVTLAVNVPVAALRVPVVLILAALTLPTIPTLAVNALSPVTPIPPEVTNND